jgi:anti-sigma factor RsiW
MNCREVNEYLDDLILGELSPEIEIKIRDHLETCASCGKELSTREAAAAFLRTDNTLTPGSHLYTRIAQQLPRAERNPTGAPSWLRTLAFATAAFVFGIICMRAADMFIMNTKLTPTAEARYRPVFRAPFSDTVLFHVAPSKHLVKL